MPVPITPEIHRALDRVYSAFGGYPLRAVVAACSHCHPDTQGLHRLPLRRLTAHDLDDFSFSALTTIGDSEDFRHFLPRILELLLTGELLSDVEVILGKLRYASWREWPQAEQNATEGFLACVWTALLSVPAFPTVFEMPVVDDWLCGFARAGLPLRPYFELMTSQELPNAIGHLSHYILYRHEHLQRSEPPPGYWEDAVLEWSDLRDWLVGPVVRARLAEAISVAGAEEALAIVLAVDHR